jgi:hypothetical protein
VSPLRRHKRKRTRELLQQINASDDLADAMPLVLELAEVAPLVCGLMLRKAGAVLRQMEQKG